VGFDPKAKARYTELGTALTPVEKQLGNINRDLQNLVNIKKQRKSLPEDKEEMLGQLADKRKELMAERSKIKDELKEIQELFNQLENRGHVSASGKVYPGVKIVIREAVYDVRGDYRAVSFLLDNGLVQAVKYEEPKEVEKEPDGYTNR
jgi:uncharacterized protein (DUF342 family)